MSRITTATIRKLKRDGQKIVMLTAYDYPSAKLVDTAGVDLILVGDSLGMTVLGYENTVAVTMEDMIHHTKAVVRGAKNALVVADLPFMSYQVSPALAVANAGRLLQEAGAQAVKLEGGAEYAETVAQIVTAGIPVFGHLGFTPQSVHQLGGAFFQGKTAAQGGKLVDVALRLEAAGICGLVLELVPWEVAAAITERLKVPTIGIGSGPACDGQVLVFHDLLGFNPEFRPRHNKVYAEMGPLVSAAVCQYCSEVREGKFPETAHTRRMAPDEYELFCRYLEETDQKEEQA
ncbi:MAG TPA: 3-methyl-2-oxobutanoate hydroxymethyltransferase [Bacillota bacterium]